MPYSDGPGLGCLSGLVASRCGFMAVLEENDEKMFIYNHERKHVLNFPLNCPKFSYAFQMAFDRHNNIIIAMRDRDSLLRFNMNGKALPHLEVPVNNPIGVACSPEGDIFVSSTDHVNTIVKKSVGQSEWVTIYCGQDDEDDEDNCDEYQDDDDEDNCDEYQDDDDDMDFDPTRFTPGQMFVGSDGELFVAADNCVNVLSTFDGKLKRQIGCDKYRDGELSRVMGICVTGDDYLFVSSDDNCIHVFETDGDYVNKFGWDGGEPWGIAVDWEGYLLVSDSGDSNIKVF